MFIDKDTAIVIQVIHDFTLDMYDTFECYISDVTLVSVSER